MGLFDNAGLKQVQPFGGGRYFVPGTAIVEVTRLHIVKSQHPDTKDDPFFTAEHSVLKFTGLRFQSVEGDKPWVDTSGRYNTGDSVTHNFNYADKKYGKINAKEYMAAILQAYTNQRLGKPQTYAEAMAALDDEIGNQLFDGALAAQVPGLQLKVQCWSATRDSGAKDFTKKSFESFVGE
jgi:hypothetical protein